MERAERAHVFDVEGHPGLVGMDGLMLGAVVHEHPPDILHHRDCHDIGEENHQPQHSLEQVEYHRVIREAVDELGGPGGDDDEQHHRQDESERHRQQDLLRRQLFLLLAGSLGGERQRLEPVHQRFRQGDHAAQHRFLQDRISLGNRNKRLLLDRDVAGGFPHRRSDVARPAHHHALDNRLPADIRLGLHGFSPL